ncbi:MAG TPA: Clp protease N-terminal domain-containing protein [Candidatus Acidoferrum sp.]|nr:Clp protease N-terminal domain-containing protein [Candidatus Acidoferrum sp.]
MKWFPSEKNVDREIRAEIERRITRGERISISLEVPLSSECKRALNLASESSEKLGHRKVDTEHLLLGILRVEGSLAAQILLARNLKPDKMEAGLGKSSEATNWTQTAISRLNSFLAGVQLYDWQELAPFFSKYAQFIDCSGRRWVGREEIEKQFADLFAPYAKKSATFILEDTASGPAGSLVASIVWENVMMNGKAEKTMHRMTTLIAPEGDSWAIFLLQFTPILKD